MATADISPEPSEHALHSAARLFFKLGEAFPTYVSDFHAKWDAWQQALGPSSEPETWDSMAEFAALAALGPKAIPLVLWQLVKGQKDATAVFLYIKLEHDPSFIVHDTSLELQVATILENNFRRTRAIRNALLDWAEYFDRGLVSRSEGPTDCEEFEGLVKLGPPVIPQMMLMYKPRDGPIFGYELLHAIMWGYTTQQQTVSLSQQYQMWDEWFQGKAYDEAPHYSRPEERQAAGLDY